MAKIAVQSFEEYVHKAGHVSTPDQLFDLFVETMRQFGYDQVLLGFATDHKEIGIKAGIGIIENCPDGWMKHYHENSLEKIDPIISFGVHQSGGFEWNKIGKVVRLKRNQINFLNQSDEAGLHNGLTVPLRGRFNEIAGVSLSTKEKKDACQFSRDILTAHCNHFYISYKRLHTKQDLNPKNIVLTPLERDILIYAALGHTDDEIGDKLKISRHTVNKYFRLLYSKFDANNRILAVVKALSIGLISL
jgi:DNA-binding CsgD family transcriptional regulator